MIKENDTFHLGEIELSFIETPGHTPACLTIKIENNIFTGDTLFMPDFGVGRCDFPGASAKTLFSSVQKIYQLPDDMNIYVGHDYRPGVETLPFKQRY